jgi:cytochrome c551/c552
MKRRESMKVIVMVLVICGLVFSGTLALGQEKKAPTPQGLFQEKCSACHKVDKATGKKKDAAGWEETVMRMIKKNKAAISDGEAKVIIDYLAKNYGVKK